MDLNMLFMDGHYKGSKKMHYSIIIACNGVTKQIPPGFELIIDIRV